MAEDALRIDAITKRYGARLALDRVGLTVRPGERVALLGHNGAGKTTLIRSVLGHTPIDGGAISIFGVSPAAARGQRLAAYLPEAVSFPRALTAREQLALFARLAGEAPAVVGPLLDRVGLTEAADRRIGTYSKGMRQRVGLAQVMIGHPRLALLDEPTSGLDPISRQEFYSIVDDLAAAGTAILLSSHALTELEARTDRIVILRRGRLAAEGSLEDLRRRAALPVRMRLRARTDAAGAVIERTGGTPVNGRSVEISCPPEDKMRWLGRIADLGPLVEDLDLVPPSLDDLYRHYSSQEVPG